MLPTLPTTTRSKSITAGIDGIVHLGGHSNEGPWDTIHKANIVGCYNLFEAAYRAGVKRVVFASSNHAVGFYPRDQKIGVNVTLRPDSRYGVSKAFGEAVGALYADKHGLRVTCIRIGYVNDIPLDRRWLSIWIKPEDFLQLVRIGLEHPDIRFDIFYGIIGQRRCAGGITEMRDASVIARNTARRISRRKHWSSRLSFPPIRSATGFRAARTVRPNTMPTANRERWPFAPNKNPADNRRGFAKR